VLNRGVGRRMLFTKLAFCRLARTEWRSSRVHAAVETEDYFYRVVRYVEQNALRANLVERAEAWRWSSLRRAEREDPTFPILSTWPLPRPADWAQIVNQPQTDAELAALRCCVNRGRPFGDSNWVTDTAKRLGLKWTLRRRGRPKQED